MLHLSTYFLQEVTSQSSAFSHFLSQDAFPLFILFHRHHNVRFQLDHRYRWLLRHYMDVVPVHQQMSQSKKKINKLAGDGESLVDSIQDLLKDACRFLPVGGIAMTVSCTIVVKLEGAKEELQKMDDKLTQMNKLHRFCSATESVADLEKICGKLQELERELRTLVANEPNNVTNFATLEILSGLVNKTGDCLGGVFGALRRRYGNVIWDDEELHIHDLQEKHTRNRSSGGGLRRSYSGNNERDGRDYLREIWRRLFNGNETLPQSSIGFIHGSSAFAQKHTADL